MPTADFHVKSHTSTSLHRTDAGIALLLLAIVFITKAPTLTLPYHWDELEAYVRPAHYLAMEGLWRIVPGMYPDTPEYEPAIGKENPAETFFGHPPGLYFSLALFYTLITESVWISHLFAITFAFLGVYYTYRLGNFLFDRVAGLFAALFLFGTPLYFTQAGLVLGDLPITALGVMSIYYALREKYGVFLFCSIYMVLVKETSIAILMALWLYVFWTKKNQPDIKRKLLFHSIPILILGIFFLWQRLATGSVFPNPYMDYNQVFYFPWSHARWVIRWTLIEQYRWVLCGLVLVHFLVCRRRAWKKEYILFALIGLFYMGAFCFLFFMTRYILPFLPYLCLAGAAAIVALTRNRGVQAAVTVIILIAFGDKFYGHYTGYSNYGEDLQYTDMIAIHQEACRYIENNYENPNVVTLYPVSLMLQEPYLGYVSKPIPVVSCEQDFDVIVYVKHREAESPRYKHDPLQEIIAANRCHLVKNIAKNGKSLQIYVSE
jgi:4-amino-4-deoxy-L-arabinose transferase-like glycosyltransferase